MHDKGLDGEDTDKYAETLYLHYEINANEMHDYKCFRKRL